MMVLGVVAATDALARGAPAGRDPQMFYIIGLTDQKSCASQRHSFFRCLRNAASLDCLGGLAPHLCQRDCIAESSATRQAQRIPLLLFHLKRHGTRHRPDVWIVIFIDTRLERSCPNRVLRAQPEFQLHGLSGRESVEI